VNGRQFWILSEPNGGLVWKATVTERHVRHPIGRRHWCRRGDACGGWRRGRARAQA